MHLVDGLAFVSYAVINKCWPQHTGIEINALIGLVAFSSLATLGTWKDIKGVDVWLLKRMKILMSLSVVFDVTQEVLHGTSMPKNCTNTFPHDSQRSLTCCALTDLLHPYTFPYDIQALRHFILLLRILLLVLLFFALMNPVVTESKASPADGVLEDQSTSTHLLPSPGVNHPRFQGLVVRTGAGNYGTFDNGATYAATGQAPSPEATDHAMDKIQVCLCTVFS
jgi:hypothetical protein